MSAGDADGASGAWGDVPNARRAVLDFLRGDGGASRFAAAAAGDGTADGKAHAYAALDHNSAAVAPAQRAGIGAGDPITGRKRRERTELENFVGKSVAKSQRAKQRSIGARNAESHEYMGGELDDCMESRTYVAVARGKRNQSLQQSAAVPAQAKPVAEAVAKRSVPGTSSQSVIDAAQTEASTQGSVLLNAPIRSAAQTVSNVGCGKQHKKKKTRSRQKNLRRDTRTGIEKPAHLTEETLNRGRLRRPAASKSSAV